MLGIRTVALVALYLSSVFGLAAPAFESSRERIARSKSRVLNGQFALNQAVTFQTVTNTETQAGTITETCQVRLTPVNLRGQDAVKEDKACTFQVIPSNNNLNQNQNNNNNNNNNNLFSSASLDTSTLLFTNTELASFSTIEATQVQTSFLDTATIAPAISEIGVSSVGATEIGNEQATFAPIVPAISELGPSFIPATETLGALTTINTLVPTAAAAQESQPAAAQVPGRKLEVLPIGLGVFAGISVIALIVVGLVTYERTKYRKAFRQRKLAEAGANMGYGGMAERT